LIELEVLILLGAQATTVICEGEDRCVGPRRHLKKTRFFENFKEVMTKGWAQIDERYIITKVNTC
jgi:hypothetical protein